MYSMRRLVTVVIAYAAVQRALRSELAVFALVVDAKDDLAEGFYRHHGFISLWQSTSETRVRADGS
jgi:hypothetical protein